MPKGKRSKDADSIIPSKAALMEVDPKNYIYLFYGPPGVGKSTFVNDFGGDRVLFLSTDRGSRNLKTKRIEVMSTKQMNKMINALEEEQDRLNDEIDFLCVDHLDDWLGFIEEDVLDDMNIESLGDAEWGKGWKKFRKEVNDVLFRLMRLGPGIVFICHEELKEIETRSIKLTRTMPALPKAAYKTIIPKADLIGYCGFKSIKKGGKRQEVRILETVPREDLYLKDRTNRSKPSIDEYEELDGKAFRKSFKQE